MATGVGLQRSVFPVNSGSTVIQDPLRGRPYTLEKLEESERKGVPNIWLIDPRLQKMSVYSNGDLHEICDDVISTRDGQIAITREEIFRD